MSDFQFNVVKGRAASIYADVKAANPANSVFTLVLLKTAVAQATMEDFADLGALLADVGNTEADFTNYARIELAAVDLAALPAADNINNLQAFTFPDQLYTAAGGTTDNTLAQLIICHDLDSTAGTDANLVPVLAFDFVVTTQGINMDLKFPAECFQSS